VYPLIFLSRNLWIKIKPRAYLLIKSMLILSKAIVSVCRCQVWRQWGGGCSPQPNILLFPVGTRISMHHRHFIKSGTFFPLFLGGNTIGIDCKDSWTPITVGTLTALAPPPSNYFLGPSLVDIAYQDDQIIVWNVAFCQGHSRQCKIGTGLFCRHSLQASQWCICIRNWMLYLNHSWISEWRNTYPLTPRYF